RPLPRWGPGAAGGRGIGCRAAFVLLKHGPSLSLPATGRSSRVAPAGAHQEVPEEDLRIEVDQGVVKRPLRLDHREGGLVAEEAPAQPARLRPGFGSVP